MSDKTTTQENPSGVIADVDIFRGVQGGVNVKFTFAQVKTWITNWLASVTPSFLGLSVTGLTGIGYGVGAGSTIGQTVSKAGTVILNKPSGQITTNNAALGGGTSVVFQLTNSCIAATDVVAVSVLSGFATPGTYQAVGEAAAAGSCKIHLRNVSGGSLSEALVLQFVVIKGSIT